MMSSLFLLFQDATETRSEYSIHDLQKRMVCDAHPMADRLYLITQRSFGYSGPKGIGFGDGGTGPVLLMLSIINGLPTYCIRLVISGP